MRRLLLALLIAFPASAQYYGRRGPLPPPSFTLKGTQTGSAPFTVAGVSTSGPSLIIISVHWKWSATAAVTSVTVGGNNAVQKVRIEDAGFQGVEMWTYWSPSALTSVDVVVSMSPMPNGGMAVTEATRTTAGSPGNTNTGSGTSTSEFTNNVTISFTNARVISSCGNLASAGTPSLATYTELADFTDGVGDFFQLGHNGTFSNVGDGKTITWTISPVSWVCAALEVRPAQ